MAIAEAIPFLILGPLVIVLFLCCMLLVVAVGAMVWHGMQDLWYTLKEERIVRRMQIQELKEASRDMYE